MLAQESVSAFCFPGMQTSAMCRAGGSGFLENLHAALQPQVSRSKIETLRKGMLMAAILETCVDVWDWLMEHLLYINLFLSVIIVFFQRRDPKAVWTWLLALYFVPIFGFLLYLVLCQDFRKSKMFRIKEVEDRLNYTAKVQGEGIQNRDNWFQDPLSRDYEDLVLYNLTTSGAVLTVDNEVDIFSDGEEKFRDLREEMSRAAQYIHIQYYIIKNDEVFQSMIPILERKAKEGVEVRILYDGMGGRFMPKRVWRQLRQAGIQVGVFFPPVLGRLNLRVNYRNHRKIVVIDGKVGYVGGFNIGKEYISKDPKFGYWRDTHLKIRGSAVYSLQIRFALDWNYATKENLFRDARYFGVVEEVEVTVEEAADDGWLERIMETDEQEPSVRKERRRIPVLEHVPTPEVFAPHVGIQIINSGPDASNRQIRNNYLQLIYNARHHVYIQTPYFVPDDAVLSALKIAAESGLDVRLMIPCKPDHPFVYWATYSYLGDLLEAGAKCYTYENGFIHAKGVMTDGLVSCFGTANMDIRSFELNFEVNATIFDAEITEKLEALFIKDMDHCLEMTRERYEQRGLVIRAKEQCCRLLSPLL